MSKTKTRTENLLTVITNFTSYIDSIKDNWSTNVQTYSAMAHQINMILDSIIILEWPSG